MLEIFEVKTHKQIRDFLNLPLKMYKNSAPFVPPLYSDEKKMFKPNYMYYDQSEAKCWVAYKDGKCVGRIQAILQRASNKKWNQKRVRFTRVDFIDDEEVSKALFKKDNLKEPVTISYSGSVFKSMEYLKPGIEEELKDIKHIFIYQVRI
mgnify:CR=1 FL=1